MNKLLLLALLGFALIAIAGAEEEREENIKDIEEVENREVREAGKGKETKRKGISGNNTKKKAGNKNKKNKQKKSKRNNKKKSGKNKKKAQKNKKKSEKSGKKNGRKAKKASKKKGKKSGNKSRKSKKKGKSSRKKSGKKSKKKGMGRKQKKQNQIRASTCLNYTCIDTAISYLKMLKDKVANFEKQDARITKQNKTGGSKSGKKGLFGPVIRRINENGGGNSSNLTCNGKKNSGAAQLTNLTDTLLKCEDEIKNNCDPSNLPLPNITEVTTCKTAISTFKNKTGECLKKTGSAACTCWADDTIASTAATVKTCDLSANAKTFAKALKNCTSAFGKCRKYEDDVGTALHACNLDTGVLKKKLKNLNLNSAALTSTKTKLDTASSRRSARDASSRALSCSAVITTTTSIISMVSQAPYSYSIYTATLTITSSTFTCTDAEKTTLKASIASVTSAIASVAAEVTHIQEVYESLTGSKATDAEIEAATICKTDDECDSLIVFPTATTASPTTAAPTTAAPAPSPAAASTAAASTAPASSAAPSSAAPSSAAPSSGETSPAASSAAPSSAAPSSAAPSSAAPSSEGPSSAASSPAAQTSAAPTSDASSSDPTPPPETPIMMMTTGPSTRRARRYVQQLMRKRMVQTLI